MATPIFVDILARLHQRTIEKTEKETVKRFQNMGQKAAEELTRGIETAAPRVRRAMHGAADAATDYARRSQALAKAQKAHAAAGEKAIKVADNISRAYQRNADIADEVAQSERELATARKAQKAVARGIETREENLRRKREKHHKTAEILKEKERTLNEIRKTQGSKAAVEYEKTLFGLRRQSDKEAAYITKKEDELKEKRVQLEKANQQVTAAEGRLNEIRKEQKSSVKELNDAEQDLIKTREEAKKLDEDIVRLNEDVARSNRKREESLRSLADAEIAEQRRAQRRGGKKSGGLGVVGNMLTDLPFVPSGRAGAFIGGGMLMGLASAAEAVVTAGQSMAILPAILTAAGAGFGTLALGVSGFADTVKELGDPEKFAEAIQGLSPAAQQAALEIQYLVQGPLGDLKNATQETLFAGVAEQFRNVTNQFLPSVQTLTGGIAGSFNNMFSNFTGQLMSPESMQSISNIVNDIVSAFQKLEPAVAPFTSALTKIVETGASFLPGFSDGIAEAARTFNEFITRVQADGSLQEFMQKGVDAAIAVRDTLWEIGSRIFETFGNKSPEEFKQTLDSMVDAAFAVAQAIVGISHVINDLLGVIQPVADAFGGWEGLVKAAGAAFLAWKTAGVLGTVAELAGSLLGVSSTLDAIPTKAAGAGGALSRLAGVLRGGPWMALAAALGVSAYTIYDGMQQPGYSSNHALNPQSNPGQPGVPIAPRGPIGPGLPAPPPNLPATPGATPPGTPGGSPLDIFAPTTNGPDGGKVPYYKQWYGDPKSAPPPPPTAGLDPFSPHPVPPPPPPDGSEPSKSEALNNLLSTMDPSKYMPGPPVGGMPTMTTPGPGGMPMMPMPMMGNVTGQTSGYEGLQSGAKMLEAAVRQQFPMLGQIGGWRADGQGSSDHPSGNALDIMIPNWETEAGKMLGDQINQWLLSNAGTLGIDSTIWRDQMMYASGQSGGTVPGHQNHIHARTTQSPNANGQPPLMWGTGGEPYAQPGYGYWNVDPGRVRDAENRLGREANDVARARMELDAKKQLGYTVQEIRDAEQKVKEEEAAYADAYQDFIEARQGTWKEINNSSGGGGGAFDSIIDSDFGISRGLGGIADNLVKFFGSILMYPIMNPLQQLAQGSGGAFGLMGQLGAQGAFNFGSSNPMMNATAMPYGPGGVPTMPTGDVPLFNSFGDPSSPQAIANMIYQQAISRGYTPHEAQSIVAYAIGESSLNPGISGGAQGGAGAANEVVGLFQQKPAFAQSNGIDPSMRSDPVANTYAYLNALDKTRAANPSMSIEQLLPKTSVGGPLASGAGAQPQSWGPLMDQAAQYLGLPMGGFRGNPFPTSPAPTGMGWLAPALPTQGFAGEGLPFGAMPQSPSLGGGAPPNVPLGVGGAAGTNPLMQTPQVVGQAPGQGGWQPSGGGGLSVPGLNTAIGAASAAAPALDAMAPGAGQAAAIAAETAGKLINRTVQFGGQLAAVGVNGLMETFGLSDSVLGDPQKSWFGRVAAGLAGARPALPNQSGQTQAPIQPQQQQGSDPNTTEHGKGGKPGPTVNIESFVQAPNRNSQQTIQDLAFRSHAAGQR